MQLNGRKLFRFVFIGLLIILIAYYFYPESKFPANVIIDKIEVYKSKREMLVYSKGILIKTYKVSIGGTPVGRKEYEGDKKTPEGVYSINAKNPNSGWYKNLGVSYPNKEDVRRAKLLGKAPGGDVKIHGVKNGYAFIGKFQRWLNWTAGCIALTDQEVDEIYDHTPIGTKIEIKP